MPGESHEARAASPAARPSTRFPPSLLSAGLSVGTALIGAILALQYSQQAVVEPAQARTLLWAFLLSGLFTLTGLLFAKGEAQKREAA